MIGQEVSKFEVLSERLLVEQVKMEQECKMQTPLVHLLQLKPFLKLGPCSEDELYHKSELPYANALKCHM